MDFDLKGEKMANFCQFSRVADVREKKKLSDNNFGA